MNWRYKIANKDLTLKGKVAILSVGISGLIPLSFGFNFYVLNQFTLTSIGFAAIFTIIIFIKPIGWHGLTKESLFNKNWRNRK